MADSIRRFLRLRAVQSLTGLGKTTIYARIQKGEFPAPVPLGEGRNSPVGWVEDEVARWQATRLAKRDAKTTAKSAGDASERQQAMREARVLCSRCRRQGAEHA